MFIFFTKVRNASEKLQLLCLSEEKSSDKRDLLQLFLEENKNQKYFFSSNALNLLTPCFLSAPNTALVLSHF